MMGRSGASKERFGANSVVHRAAPLKYSTDLPIVIKIGFAG
jgi:hypothetical protein